MSSYDETRQAIEDAREAQRQTMTLPPNGRIRLDPTIAFQIVAWIVGVMLVYGAVNVRVSVLETKYDALKESLSVINLKLDRLMEQK